MKISLSNIKPAPRPIRDTWDEQALDELAQSIKTQGVVVPVKVRPVGDKYETVYGHRRVEAMKRAGMKETDALVEGLDDKDALFQQIIENELREDVPPLEKAKGYSRGVGMSGSIANLSRQVGIPPETINDSLRLLKQSKEIQELVASAKDHRTPEGKITTEHISKVAILDDGGDRQAVLKKAAKEGLTAKQARRVAETVKVAPSEQAKKKVLEWEYSPTLHDPERIRARAKKYGAHDVMYREKKPRADADWREAPDVAVFLEVTKTFREAIGAFRMTIDIGKLAPEGRPFIARRLHAIREEIDRLIAELEKGDG